MGFFYPDRYINRITQINLKEDLLNNGYSNVLLDVDNTILTRDEHIVPADVMQWISDAKNMGIKFCLVSNDWHKNVRDLAVELNLDIVVRSMKPFPAAFLVALKKIGANNKNTIMIGDQLLTDVLGSHFVGLNCILVRPLVQQDLKHTLILRKIENLILKNKVPE